MTCVGKNIVQLKKRDSKFLSPSDLSQAEHCWSARDSNLGPENGRSTVSHPMQAAHWVTESLLNQCQQITWRAVVVWLSW